MLPTMRKLNLLTTLFFSSLLLHSCGDKTTSNVKVDSSQYIKLESPSAFLASWSKENKVIVHELTEPDNLHPCNGSSQVRSEIFLYLHAALLRTDLRTGTIQPGLSKALPEVSADKLDLIFDLRNDVKWDDGSIVTPEDVIFTIKVAKSPLTNNAAFKPYFDLVEKVEMVSGSPSKVLIRMKKVYVQNIALWADYPIIQRKFFDPENILNSFSFVQFNDTTFNASAQKDLMLWSEKFNAPGMGFDKQFISGCGPYRLKDWNSGQLLVLEKKKNHWSDQSSVYAEKSFPDEIIFKVNKDAVSTELAFMKQELDASTSLSSRSLIQLLNDSLFNKNYHGRFVDVYGYTFIGMNMQPKVSHRAISLSDLQVRKALSLLTPVKQIIEVVCKGVNKPINGPVAKMKASYNSALKIIELDVLAANNVLDAAQWKMRDDDGVRMKELNGKKERLEFEFIFLATTPEWKEMALMIEESYKKAGIKLNLNAVDLPTWLDKGTSHDFDMIMGSWNSSALPEDYAQLWANSSWKENGLNFSGFGNESTDALIDSIAITMNDEERNGMEKRIQAEIYKEQPYIFLYGLVRRTAIHRRFSGAELYSERPGVLFNSFQIENNSVGVKANVNP